MASEKSELKLFFDEIDGINICCCLLGEVLGSRKFIELGADFLRRLSENIASKGNLVKACKVDDKSL